MFNKISNIHNSIIFEVYVTLVHNQIQIVSKCTRVLSIYTYIQCSTLGSKALKHANVKLYRINKYCLSR